MYNAGTLGCADLFPGYDGVYYILLSGEFVKWAAIAPADHIAAPERLDNMVVTLVAPLEGLQHGQQFFGQVIVLAVLLDFDVGQVRIHGCRNVGCQRPGRGCPYQEVFTGAAYQRQAYIETKVSGLFVTL